MKNKLNSLKQALKDFQSSSTRMQLLQSFLALLVALTLRYDSVIGLLSFRVATEMIVVTKKQDITFAVYISKLLVYLKLINTFHEVFYVSGALTHDLVIQILIELTVLLTCYYLLLEINLNKFPEDDFIEEKGTTL